MQSGLVENETLKLIEAAYEIYFQAFRNRDIDGVMSVLDDGFIWKSGADILDRQQTQDAITEQLSALLSVDDASLSIDKIHLDGDQAVVTVTETVTATAKAEDGLTTSTTKEVYRDVWYNTAKGWKLRASELLAEG